MRRRVRLWGVIAVGMLGATWSGTPAPAAELRPGTWTLGGGVGVLRDTPDGTAFALNGYAETLVAPRLSLGPLLQLGFTGDLSQIGLSGQVKYWIDVPQTARRLMLTVQGGLGFVHSDRVEDDTSWLIPLGVGADYALSPTLSATGTFLINLTDLDTGRRTGADVMPGLTFGLRF
jgi:hypothetical protein